MSKPGTKTYENAFISILNRAIKESGKDAIPKDGIKHLLNEKKPDKWTDVFFDTILNALSEKNQIKVKSGPGSCVTFCGSSVKHPRPKSIKSETDLYLPIISTLKKQISDGCSQWKFQNSLVCDTHASGASKTGGKWTRPDITMLGVNVYEFLPGKILDVITFEVKMPKNIEVTAVYEALSHYRAATKSYVWLYYPDSFRNGDTNLIIEKIKDIAKSHGIGVIVASDAEDFHEWEIIEAERHEPAPDILNQFISDQIKDSEERERIKNMVRIK